VTDAPIAYTVHPGGRAVSPEQQQALARWLPANGINPNLVSVAAPVTVLPVPHGQGPDGQSWLIQVIVFEQFHVDHTGVNEHNLITGQPVTFQRTVPLQVPYPFPTAPTTDGEDHGQEVEPVEEGQRPPQHQGGPQEDERQELRPAEAEALQDRRSAARAERPRKGSAERIEDHAEEDPREGHQAVSQPEEDQPEEVGAAR